MVIPLSLFRAPSDPARHAYSHCASVGRSNASPVFARRIPMKLPASTAAEAGHLAPAASPRIMPYETRSTGRAAPA